MKATNLHFSAVFMALILASDKSVQGSKLPLRPISPLFRSRASDENIPEYLKNNAKFEDLVDENRSSGDDKKLDSNSFDSIGEATGILSGGRSPLPQNTLSPKPVRLAHVDITDQPLEPSDLKIDFYDSKIENCAVVKERSYAVATRGEVLTPTLPLSRATEISRDTGKSPIRRFFSFKREKVKEELRPKNIEIPGKKADGNDSVHTTPEHKTPEEEKRVLLKNGGSPTNLPEQRNRRSSRVFSTRTSSVTNGSQHNSIRYSRTQSRSISPLPNFFAPTAQKLVELPTMLNNLVYGDSVEYDKWLSEALYLDGEEFEYVSQTEYGLIGLFIPCNSNAVSTTLYEANIKGDMAKEEFQEFLGKLREYAEFPEHEDFSVRNKNEAAKMMVAYSLGKASTMSFDDVWKISDAPQRTVVTTRDLFYYPGMLQVAALFNHLFDPNRANEFFYQFIKTFYSGVYGPKREDLFGIARIEDIPVGVIKDNLIKISLGMTLSKEITLDQANFEVEKLKSDFYDPEKREMLVQVHGKETLNYRELDPVPKTLEDVLDATVEILKAYWRKHAVVTPSKADEENILKAIKVRVFNENHVDIMQSFYLTKFSPIEVKTLMDTLVLALKNPNLRHKKIYRNFGASFMYAAYIQSLATTEGLSPTMMMEKLNEMFWLGVDRRALERVKLASAEVANMNLKGDLNVRQNESDNDSDDENVNLTNREPLTRFSDDEEDCFDDDEEGNDED